MVGGRKKVISFFAGTAWLRSCRFLFHKFIQRDKAHKVIGNADVLPPLAAALIRCFNVDRLDKLPQPEFIEEIFYKRFKKERPDIVKPLKQILKEQEIKDKEKKKEKEKRRKEHEQEQMNNGTDEVLPF